MRLECKSGESIEVRTAAQLDAALDAIQHDPARSHPVVASLDGPAGFLAIGVGNPRVSILMYGTHDRSQQPLHAIGDEAGHAAGEKTPYLAFWSNDRPGDYARWMGLPPKMARAVARHFLEHDGALSDAVRWEQEGHAS